MLKKPSNLHAIAARHGTLGEYDTIQEDWLSYTEWLQQFITANDVRRAEKVSVILLSSI